MAKPLKFSVPINENANLTLFVNKYNDLSPFVSQQAKEREIMLREVVLNGSYYDAVL